MDAGLLFSLAAATLAVWALARGLPRSGRQRQPWRFKPYPAEDGDSIGTAYVRPGGKRVASFPSLVEAELFSALLRSSGIPASPPSRRLNHETAYPYPVYVAPEDLDAARALYEEMHGDPDA